MVLLPFSQRDAKMEKSGLWRAKKEMLLMIITTTPSVEGRTIREYKGVVFGEVISGVNIFRDFGAGLSNIFGGRSAGYEEELQMPAARRWRR